jgi:flagellar assembly protein FliH
MSLSSKTEQANLAEIGYEPFKMESFDTESSTTISKKDGGYVFQAFFEDNSEHTISFEHMLPDSTEAAQKILDNAKTIVKEAQDKAASIEQDAYQKGFAQGEKDGVEMGLKKMDKILENIQHVLEELVSHKDEFSKLHDQAILDLICCIATKVVQGRSEIDNEIVRETIFQAFELAADRSEIVVKVSSEDIEHVKDLRPEFFERIKDLKSLTIESDPTISPGGCLLETAFGHVDGRIESQMKKVAESVKKAFAQEQGGPVSDSGMPS